MSKRKQTTRRRPEPPILAWLEEEFAKVRKNVTPLYPYDPKTNSIQLPEDIEKDLRLLVLMGNKVAAVKRVIELTGAGLRVSKDYVDNLARKQRERRRTSGSTYADHAILRFSQDKLQQLFGIVGGHRKNVD